MTATASSVDRGEQLVERLFGATIQTLELFSVYFGTELGLYAALARGDGLTVDQLATETGIHPRYAQEWLEQQAVAGIVDVDDAGRPAHERRYSLDAAHAAVLTEPDDPAHIAPFAHMVAGVGKVLPQIAEAYRTGSGVPFADYGAEMRHGQGHINRPAFTHDLAGWIATMPDVEARLRDAERPARVIDVGCGQGWAALGVAAAFPHARVDGIDLDAGSIADATASAAERGLSDRVRFSHQDAAELASGEPYDLAILVEVLHDVAHPVEVLASLRPALAPDGSVLVIDERVAERFTAPGDDIERMMYGWSVTHCLPASMAEEGSAAIGTAIRPGQVREIAQAAGFPTVEILPVDNDLFRFYRLRA